MTNPGKSITSTSLEGDFPIVEVSQLAEQESWRKEINRPIYHIHKWWATRLGSVFRAITLAALSRPGTSAWQNFYKQHDLAGKVVLDPFMGSGTTVGETLKLGANAIGCDINPVSTFLVTQALTPTSEKRLRTAFQKLEAEVAPQIRHFYTTIDPDTGQRIPVLYYFWVKTVVSPDGETIPLLSSFVFAQDAYPKKKPLAHIVCPQCWTVFRDRYDSTDTQCPSCNLSFNPQKGPASGQYVSTRQGTKLRIKELLPVDGSPPRHHLYAMLAVKSSGEKVYLNARAGDFELFREAEALLKNSQLPLPTMDVRPGHNTNQARGYNYRLWRDFFNSRQLLCLGLLLAEIQGIEDAEVRDQLLCLFSGTLEFNNMFCSYKGEGTGAVRHMFSNHILKPERTPLENSVWGHERSSGTFSTLFESRLIRAKRYLHEPFDLKLPTDLFGQRMAVQKVVVSAPVAPAHVATWDALKIAKQGVMILNGDSACLPLPSGVVDAVITDPPYFDFVHYSELSDFFFAWLAPVLKDRYAYFQKEDSSDKGEVQQKDPSDFARQLSRVFTECRRVLKPDGVLAFSFHHSRAEGWAAIYLALSEAGMFVVAAHPVHAELRSSSPKAAAKNPISLDAILVCRKQPSSTAIPMSVEAVIRDAQAKAGVLEAAGLSVSSSDLFVIGAALLLISNSAEVLSFSDISDRLEQLRLRLYGEGKEMQPTLTAHGTGERLRQQQNQ